MANVKKITVITEYNGGARVIEEWKEFNNERRRLVHYVDEEYGFEYWYEYDGNGNQLHYHDTKGKEEWYSHNEDGELISYKDAERTEEI